MYQNVNDIIELSFAAAMDVQEIKSIQLLHILFSRKQT